MNLTIRWVNHGWIWKMNPTIYGKLIKGFEIEKNTMDLLLYPSYCVMLDSIPNRDFFIQNISFFAVYLDFLAQKKNKGRTWRL